MQRRAFREWLDEQDDADEFELATCEGFCQAWRDPDDIGDDYEKYDMELKYETAFGDDAS